MTDANAGRIGGMAVSDDTFEAKFREPCEARHMAACGASPFGFMEAVMAALKLAPRQVIAVAEEAAPDAEPDAPPPLRCWIVAHAAEQGQPGQRVARVGGMDADTVNRALADLADQAALDAAA